MMLVTFFFQQISTSTYFKILTRGAYFFVLSNVVENRPNGIFIEIS